MIKLMFAPFRIISSRLAGVTSRKLSARVWSMIDDRKPPQPSERRASWPKLLAGLLIEGAVFRLVSGAADHAARLGFARLTGRWPGDDAPPEEQ